MSVETFMTILVVIIGIAVFGIGVSWYILVPYHPRRTRFTSTEYNDYG